MALNSQELLEYRNIIMNQLNKSNEIRNLVCLTENELAISTLAWKNFFPCYHVPGTTQDSKVFIAFDLKLSRNIANPSLKNVNVIFYIASHISNIGTDTGLRTDCIAIEVDKIFSDKNILGIGKNQLESILPHNPDKDFRGLMMTFKVLDLKNGG